MASIVIGDYTYNTDGSVMVVDKTKQSYGSILSSFEYDGQTYDVTDMSYCFSECVNLIKAPTIPESITNMKSCFEYCASLIETPIIPTSVEDLSLCFFRCTGLKYAKDFPLTTTPVLKDMAGCFAYCTSLTKAPRQIPRSVTTLENCFLGCKSLERSPQSIYSIVASGTDPLNMKSCFNGCESLKTSPELPNKVTNLYMCFYGCINLTNISSLPKNVTNVSYCFDGCRSLQGNIEVENVPEYSVDIFANLSNQNIYIINIASLEIKEDVAEEWRSIANQYRSVHYEADDHTPPQVTLKLQRTDREGNPKQNETHVYIEVDYQFFEDNIPVGWKPPAFNEEDLLCDSTKHLTPIQAGRYKGPYDLEDTESHIIKYTVNDGYKIGTAISILPRVMALVDFLGKGSQSGYIDIPGMGMAIGNVATRNGLDIQFPTTIGKGLLPPTKDNSDGTKSVDLDNYQLVVGKYNKLNNNAVFIIGNGSENKPSNLIEISNNGMSVMTIDNNGDSVPIAFLGYGEGQGASSIQYAPYINIGRRHETNSIGNYSVVEGYGTTASDFCSHAEGNGTTASGQSSHAEGDGTTASDVASHAEGYKTTANGAYSHVEGEYSEATGATTHAEGYTTKASGRFSHSQNMGTIASKDSQTAIGRYNEEDNESGLAQKAFIIGNGTSDTNRSNAFTVDWNGNTEMQGNLKINDRYTFNNVTLDTVEPVDAKQSNNGLSSGIRYPSTQNILDSNGGILSRVEGVINSNGNIGFNIYANNYNSSGTQVGRAGIQGHVDKNGNVSYGINSPDKFRAALGLGSMATINSPVPIANGGTGQTTAANAFKALSGYTLDLGTNNTTDTWVPVIKGASIQHRVIPTNILNAGQFARGQVAFGSIAVGGIVEKTISFGKTFSSTPTVVATFTSKSTSAHMGGFVLTIADVTTTGCKIRAYNNSASAREPGAYWIATNI